jgi:hypothetical protein
LKVTDGRLESIRKKRNQMENDFDNNLETEKEKQQALMEKKQARLKEIEQVKQQHYKANEERFERKRQRIIKI